MAIINIDDDRYGDLYEQWDSNILIRFFQHIKYRFILPIFRLVPKNAAVLDIGCAKGNFLRTLVGRGYTKLAGLDLSDARYAFLKDKTTFYQESITDIKTPISERYDCICVQCMLHHIPVEELAIAASNICSLLKPNGILFVYEPNMGSLAGNLFYNFFLRVIPELYKSTKKEQDMQLSFCKHFENTFVETLKKNEVNVKLSGKKSFYFTAIGRKTPM